MATGISPTTYLDGSPEVTADNWKGVFPKDQEAVAVDLDAIPGLKLDATVKTHAAFNSKQQKKRTRRCLSVGCSLPNRDAIDERIIEEVRTGTATKGDNGFIDNPSVAGGWPELKSLPAPADTDHDGMPDAWEKKAGLDASDVSDAAQDKDKDGYTNIEEYLNGTDPTVFVDYTKQSNNVNTLK